MDKLENNKSDIQLLWDNINSTDETVLKQLNNIFIDYNIIKKNLISFFLKSDNKIPISNSNDLVKLFKLFEQLNNEYMLASDIWNTQIVESKIFFQNSISKKDSTNNFYSNYIDLVKKKLIQSGIEFNYFEFRLKRFNKTKDIIFVFDLEQFSSSNNNKK
jgi:hypothetical protein